MEVKVGDYVTMDDTSHTNHGAVCLITGTLSHGTIRVRWETRGIVQDPGYIYTSDFNLGLFRPSTDAEILKAKLFGL